MKLFGVRKRLEVRPESPERDYHRPHEAVAPPFVGRWGVLSLEGRLEGEALYFCVKEDPPFVIVRNIVGQEFRVNPEQFLWLADPRFELGDQVATKVGKPRVGWIALRCWHYKERRMYYLIDIPGSKGRKRHSRCYWENELELQPATQTAQGKREPSAGKRKIID